MPWGLSSSLKVLVTLNSSLGSLSPRDGHCFLTLPSLSYLWVSFFQSSNVCVINSLWPWVLKPELSAESRGVHAQSRPTLWDSMDCGLPGSSVHGKNTGTDCHLYIQGIFPTQVSNPVFCVSCSGGKILYHCATWEVASHLEGLLKHRLLGSTPECLIQEVWGKGREFAFLSSSQVMQMVPVWGLHLKNHCGTLYSL